MSDSRYLLKTIRFLSILPFDCNGLKKNYYVRRIIRLKIHKKDLFVKKKLNLNTAAVILEEVTDGICFGPWKRILSHHLGFLFVISLV